MPLSTLEQIEQCERNQIALEEARGNHRPHMPAGQAALGLQAVFIALRKLLPDDKVGDLSGPEGLIADQERVLGVR